ncbi:hypothetical protein SK128_001565 [Halocaridina rubra]|uniref:Amino acid transporter transmembrane domain-containing protein n=1 Tax=Halocaridina rubra TaxID=373956 RepID=A0AAN9A0G7_HALRR
MSQGKAHSPSISGSISNGSTKGSLGGDRSVAIGDDSRKKGLGLGLTSFFMVAQMAGAGFVALPRALADTGWLGIPMMLVFCVSVGFSGSRLGKCWIMLEERWPEYKKPVKQPYMEMAYKAMGIVGRRVALSAVLLNLYGSTTVFIILISEMINAMNDTLATCELVLIVGCGIIPLTWLGTPKDFWQTAIVAVVSTVVACATIIAEVIMERDEIIDPWYPNPTIVSFSLGFAAILFAFGGAAVFPTVQNDMKDRSQFVTSVIVAFIIILCLYLPLAVTGYVVIGNDVTSNIFLSVNMGPIVKIAISLQIVNLISSYIVSFNPVAQSLEENFNIPNKFGPKRVLLRSSMVLGQILICLTVPNFSKILNLIGGSLITLCTFVFPPIMYIKLMDMKGPWPHLEIPLWQRVYMVEIVIVGVIGGVFSTVSAFYAIVAPGSFTANCFMDFYGEGN